MIESKIYNPKELKICPYCGEKIIKFDEEGTSFDYYLICDNKIIIADYGTWHKTEKNPCFRFEKNRYQIFNCSRFPGLTKIDIEINTSIFDLWRDPIVTSISYRNKSNEYKYAQINKRLNYPIDIIDYFPELIEI